MLVMKIKEMITNDKMPCYVSANSPTFYHTKQMKNSKENRHVDIGIEWDKIVVQCSYLLPPRPIGRGLSTNPRGSAGALTCTLGSTGR